MAGQGSVLNQIWVASAEESCSVGVLGWKTNGAAALQIQCYNEPSHWSACLIHGWPIPQPILQGLSLQWRLVWWCISSGFTQCPDERFPSRTLHRKEMINLIYLTLSFVVADWCMYLSLLGKGQQQWRNYFLTQIMILFT